MIKVYLLWELIISNMMYNVIIKPIIWDIYIILKNGANVGLVVSHVFSFFIASYNNWLFMKIWHT